MCGPGIIQTQIANQGTSFIIDEGYNYLQIINNLFVSGSKGFFYNVFCSGGINKDDPFNPKDNKENGMMAFFRDVIGNWLNKPYAKAIVLICFLGYLGVASWGVTQLKEGLEKKRLSRFDSYSVDFYDVEDKYFREYPFRINVS